MRSHPYLAMILTLTSAAAFAVTPAPATPEKSGEKTATQSEAVPASLMQLPPASKYYSAYAFVVDKSARTLAVWQQTGTGLKKVAEVPADMGRNSGNKVSRGDAKTPEGIYFLQTRLDNPQLDYHTYGKRAFTSDYPNYFDRLEGKTGNGIWLHAVPDEVALTRGSSGCVVVRNDIILDLTKYIRLGRTPILIENKAELMPQESVAKTSDDLQKWIESWRIAWEAKDMDHYIEAYSPNFKSQHMNRAQWKAFKTHLGEEYKQITVKLSKPTILTDRDRAVVRFLQEYTSDQHADFGEKVLYLKKESNGYRIIGEQWTEETSQVAREEIEATTHASSTAAISPASTTDTRAAN
jgi:murein L,D-transpeptidase YafK